jgi:hypothetical protein
MRKRCPREVLYDMKCRRAREISDRSFPGTKSRGSCQLDDSIGAGLVFGGGEVKPVEALSLLFLYSRIYVTSLRPNEGFIKSV